MSGAVSGDVGGAGAWTVVRHRVGVCGRVLAAGGLPQQAVALRLWSVPGPPGPEPGPEMLPACRLVKHAQSRADGMFFFLDCPPGQYAVQARRGTSGEGGMVLVEVAAAAAGKAAVAVADIMLASAPGAVPQ